MTYTQQAEHEAFELIGFDRFEGFDRGDLDRDYAADQNAMNEAEANEAEWLHAH